ncbi:unnamed protein product [Microthlaspi erraticum]|uniref:Uncharacterized protein n=1 Tax=Microthlaspi erraticum TaxID=1685480 RepID=A0A6D2J7S7_9BRAS|nr:unnamed protein product [Microthlaspi erraticum]
MKDLRWNLVSRNSIANGDLRWNCDGNFRRKRVPPKNWETRSWSGDGRRPSGALHATGVASWLTRSSLWLLFLLFFIVEMCVAPLALEELCLLEAVVGVQLVWEKSWYCVDRTRIQDPQTGAPPGQLDPQLDRVEFPLFGLDRVRWSSWSVWPWKSSSFSACCLLLPLARKKRLCEALGQGASFEW